MICLAEFLVHYHIDWIKECMGRKYMLTPDRIGFWRLHGSDQALHQLTYLAMLWWIIQ